MVCLAGSCSASQQLYGSLYRHPVDLLFQRPPFFARRLGGDFCESMDEAGRIHRAARFVLSRLGWNAQYLDELHQAFFDTADADDADPPLAARMRGLWRANSVEFQPLWSFAQPRWRRCASLPYSCTVCVGAPCQHGCAKLLSLLMDFK